MAYLFLGEDLKAKDARISQIKSKFFSNPEAVHFDFESLDAAGLGPDIFKKALLTLPVVAAKRLVLVRNIHKFKSADIAALLQFLSAPAEHVELVLESSEGSLKGELKTVAAKCQTVVLGDAAGASVFDMTKLMGAGRAKEALAMLNDFYKSGTHPLQIMGALVWFWGKNGRALDQQKFERGLRALEEADVNIKRSRLDPEYAVEKAVVELTGLLAAGGRR